jgi:hypothetical protein
VPLSLVGTISSVTYRLTDMDLTPPDIEPSLFAACYPVSMLAKTE